MLLVCMMGGGSHGVQPVGAGRTLVVAAQILVATALRNDRNNGLVEKSQRNHLEHWGLFSSNWGALVQPVPIDPIKLCISGGGQGPTICWHDWQALAIPEVALLIFEDSFSRLHEVTYR